MNMIQAILLVSTVFCVLFLILGLALFWMVKTIKPRQPSQDLGLSLLQNQIESLRSQLSENLLKSNELVNQQIGVIGSQVQQSLHTTTGQINTRLDNASKVVQDVSQKLGSLSQATERIFEATKTISSLEEILRPPKVRGGMGEILLENLLREIFPKDDLHAFQYHFKSGNAVDAVIRLKEGMVPIDAKFPLDNFRRMIESKDEKERSDFRKEFVRNVKKHIDDIAKKYIVPEEGTVNFALMYIPAENVYYETIVRDEGEDDLYAYSARKYVFPVSPNSLYPYLMTLTLGFRGLKIEEEARKILDELNRLQVDLGKFDAEFSLVGKHINDAQKRFVEAEKKLDRVEVKITALKSGSPSDIIEPEQLEQVPEVSLRKDS